MFGNKSQPLAAMDGAAARGGWGSSAGVRRQPPAANPNYAAGGAAASAPSSMSLLVTKSADESVALTNLALLSRADMADLAGSPSAISGFVQVGDIVLSVQANSTVELGHIALNMMHRKNLGDVLTGVEVKVTRFVPPAGKSFDLIILGLEVDFVKRPRRGGPIRMDAERLGVAVSQRFTGQVMTVGQKVLFQFEEFTLVLAVTQAQALRDDAGGTAPPDPVRRGRLGRDTTLLFDAPPDSGIKVVNQKGQSQAVFKAKEFNFEKLGIGGLDTQFADIFRRAFASRVFPPNIINRLGIKHVRGMLLHGPPGTGKTLIARQIGKMLNGKEPKVVNGPEILDKFVGASEQNIRNLFADAEKDQREHGDESELHIIIFDEIDAICKARGSSRDGTGVHDSIVNQLLTKIDGVDALNNILLIGMTNRKDMLDEALLRPGRLEVQIEIGLPDKDGRVKILQIHSNRMRENSFMAPDVDLVLLAERTQNYSGAELEGLVKSAVSFALNRQTNPDDLSKPLNAEDIKVSMADFEEALKEVRPAFGANVKELEAYQLNGMLDCLERHNEILETTKRQVEQVRNSPRTPLLTCLLEGEPGSGKTAMAVAAAIGSHFPFVKFVSAESMVGMTEPGKCAHISKVFDDAYKSKLSFVILDDIERLLEYVRIGPRFSNVVLQTLLVMLKRIPPEGHKLFVVGTTSLEDVVLNDLNLKNAFNMVLTVPPLTSDGVRAVLVTLDVFTPYDVDNAVQEILTFGPANDRDNTRTIALKRLLMLVEMAAQNNAQNGRIPLEELSNCLKEIA